MSSALGLVCTPKLSVYSASKSYLIALLKAVNEESRAHGAKFIAVCPYWVATPMTMTDKTNFMVISP